eukprot:TRINITY_DN1278_c0_g1_i13.p1 TRINITY_DN1278_c0_g1~~TRINITY_DN1278_c0_g1_i13.p1  ORF type:complete len:394 (-),score=24.60 TRINITY_DN1278_c0_g1_i13:219-1400(-)
MEVSALVPTTPTPDHPFLVAPGKESRVQSEQHNHDNASATLANFNISGWRSFVNEILSEHDTPLNKRVQCLETALVMVQGDVVAEDAISTAIRSIKTCRKRSRYDLFYPVEQIFGRAKEHSLSHNMFTVRSASIILVKLTTMARSGDLAEALPTIFQHNGFHFVRLFAKQSRCRLFRVSGITLHALREYRRHRQPHAMRFFVGLHNNRPLGSQTIANLTKRFLSDCGVDTTLFKSHSLRGAAATSLLAAGLPSEVVQQRGGWISADAFLEHYARLHQLIDYEAAYEHSAPPLVQQKKLTNDIAGDFATKKNVAKARSFSDEAVERFFEEKNPSDVFRSEGARTDSESESDPPLVSKQHCPACDRVMEWEPQERCPKCRKFVHVACFDHHLPCI